MKEGETISEGLRREVREEVGQELIITDIKPWTFRDEIREKVYPDRSSESIYMVYLIFECEAANRKISLSEEFDEHAWIALDKLFDYDLNPATEKTFRDLSSR